MTDSEILRVLQAIRLEYAGKNLTDGQLRLYGDQLCREIGSEVSTAFPPEAAINYVEDALLLLQSAFLERERDQMGEWQEGIKRAAEILEWLSLSNIKPVGVPVYLLAAAAYQVAGYPAMALGLLLRAPVDEDLSRILKELLRTNFKEVLHLIHRYWLERNRRERSEIQGDDALPEMVFSHLTMCFGVLCSYLRTGDDSILERALEKMDNLASFFLHSRDPYSFFLAKLTAETCRSYADNSLRKQIIKLSNTANGQAGKALEKYARAAFNKKRAVIWPAQRQGIEWLCNKDSFVLCTPTGSGKTTVATIAAILGLFADTPSGVWAENGICLGNLVLYLVPSRALAAEVESRFVDDLSGVDRSTISVTNLYGGADWGPSDAWCDLEKRSVLICTYEKADALIRFFGVLLLSRIRLVIVDEAHSVNAFRGSSRQQENETRSFHLERLLSRILRARDIFGFRVLALSAVASSSAPAISRWITGQSNGTPLSCNYQSTRHVVGRIEVDSSGDFTICYDLLNGFPIRPNGIGEGLEITKPFHGVPTGLGDPQHPEVQMRAPTLWAALHFASKREDGTKPTVLISITQNIEYFIDSCADAIEQWPKESLPEYFDFDEDATKWRKCLKVAEDYFSVSSPEYRLLRRGIVVHHGKMPGLLSKHLKKQIDAGLIRVIIATSTLSEGVNMPVNVILMPSLYRSTTRISLQEFCNLSGRAGRPAQGVEGKVFVVLPRDASSWNRQKIGYGELLREAERINDCGERNALAGESDASPLAEVLKAMWSVWRSTFVGTKDEDFARWLEQTSIPTTTTESEEVYGYLDALDSFLLSTIQEVEEITNTEITEEEIEKELMRIWRHTYAFAASYEEERLSSIWLTRGRAIKRLYPEAGYRHRVYKSGLSPISANQLFQAFPLVKDKLVQGKDYFLWSTEERFAYIRDVVSLLSTVPVFGFKRRIGRKTFENWENILRWWLERETLSASPSPKEIAAWHAFVSGNFIFRSTWGIGSTIALMFEEKNQKGEPILAMDIGDWPRCGLPWITFWLKEMISWGTLDPVVAFLLSHDFATTRSQAENDSIAYYRGLPADILPNDVFDPRSIMDWKSEGHLSGARLIPSCEFCVTVKLSRPVEFYRESLIEVYPLETDQGLVWVTSAGHKVAFSERPENWSGGAALNFVFLLNVSKSEITGTNFLL